MNDMNYKPGQSNELYPNLTSRPVSNSSGSLNPCLTDNAGSGLSAGNKYFPLVLLLFFGSGCAALIYEVVWFQLLAFVIGSSSISLGVLLGTYMGGMCLGSLVLPRIISARRHPLRVYAFLELGIGICGVAMLFAIPYVDKFYISHIGSGITGIMMRGAVCAMCLLLPTLLMGATLPAIARWVETTPSGVSWLGFFYGGNIVGAVFGTLLAGFYLLRMFDMHIATYVAAAINLTVAFFGIVLSFKAQKAFLQQRTADTQSHLLTNQSPTSNWTIYLAIAMSGLTALGAEVVWTRLLSLTFGGTVYTFSIILAMFLVGLGIGSSIGASISGYARNPRLILGLCQLLLAGAVGWAAYQITTLLPYWPVDPSLAKSPWLNFQIDLLRCLWAILPGALLWGASFPLALACVVSPGRDAGKVVGSVYAANTVGAILGSLGFSMLIIPKLGTQRAQQLLISLSLVSAIITLLPALWSAGAKIVPAFKIKSPALRFVTAVILIGAIVLSVLMARNVSKIPWGLIAYGRFMATMQNRFGSPNEVVPEEKVSGGGSPDIYCIYEAEGRDVSVAVTKMTSGIKSFHGAGKVQASTDPRDMRLQRMLGHLSALLAEKTESVLVVACGAGVTAGSFIPHPEVKNVVIVDIEPMVPKEVTPKFSSVNYGITDGVKDKNPRSVNGKEVLVVYDDGRHYISTLPADKKFDVITSDPIDPWVKGCAALNTKEYYQMCKDHLNPGGVMSLWMPFYENNLESVKSLISTFFEVYENGIIFSNDTSGSGYDAVLLGWNGPANMKIDLDKMQARLDDHKDVAQSLDEVSFPSAASLIATYAGRASDLKKEWCKGAQINTDRNLRLQYLAGMWLNSYMGPEILYDILKYYKYPEDLFVGSEDKINKLKGELSSTGRYGGTPAGN
jgi:spermidine synthase